MACQAETDHNPLAYSFSLCAYGRQLFRSGHTKTHPCRHRTMFASLLVMFTKQALWDDVRYHISHLECTPHICVNSLSTGDPLCKSSGIDCDVLEDVDRGSSSSTGVVEQPLLFPIRDGPRVLIYLLIQDFEAVDLLLDCWPSHSGWGSVLFCQTSVARPGIR
eukprot:scaffold2934_cov176-Amphora_coffeaeformis.AAC.8